jgi:DNA-binding CsgD family transcriptional regulator
VDIGLQAITVVDLVGAVAESLRVDRPAGGVICTHLATATTADAAAWIAVREGEGTELVWSHPHGTGTDALVAATLSNADAAGSGGLTRLRVARIGEVAILAPAELPGTGPSGALRLLALAKRKGFNADDVELLTACLPAMTMMLAQVVATSERQRRATARVEAAKELGLSERELEVLQLLSQGLLATSIASRLALSPRTVHKHLGNIYFKLGVHDRLVAVKVALAYGLVSPEG